MKNTIRIYFTALIIVISNFDIIAKNIEKENNKDTSAIYNNLKFRSIGPAFMSGRISDIIIHPKNNNVWYVTAGSGGVWKTENSGTTWDPIFDNQQSYSIGCIALDNQKSRHNMGWNWRKCWR